MNYLLRSTDQTEIKYRISLLSYSYTSDAKTRRLFLSDPARIKEHRAFFLKSGTKALKTNKERRAYFSDIVALDSACFTKAPDTILRKQMARHYNSLAWYSILTQDLRGVGYDLDQSINYDPTSKYPYANRPLFLLLSGHYNDARKLYIKYKDLPFDSGMTFKEEFIIDFKELDSAGVTHPDISKIKALLNFK